MMRLSARKKRYLGLMGITLWRHLEHGQSVAGMLTEAHRPLHAGPQPTAQHRSSGMALGRVHGAAAVEQCRSDEQAQNRQKLSNSSAQALAPIQGDDAGLAAVSPASPRPQRTGQVPVAWSQLQQQVRSCTNCALHKSRIQAVLGVGNTQADWMFIGEAPGAEEDRQGEPFVGKAGQLLNAMLQALDLTRQQVYIANILKCRPPNNRNPQADEVAQCELYLQQQLDLIRPKIIVALGAVAAQNLLKRSDHIGAMRGQRFYYGPWDIPVVVTYHPAYLLRTPKDKRKSWQDLCLACGILRNQG